MANNLRHAGFSLIELMIGVAVALITLLVLTGVLMSFNAQKRTTVSSSDAQVAGGVASFMIERDLRRAGYGLNSEPLLGCALHVKDGTVGAPNPILMQPVRIVPGSATTPDQVIVTYSTAQHGWHYATLTPPVGTSYPGDETALVVDNIFGFAADDLIAIGQSGIDPDSDGVNDCTLRQITAVDLPSATIQHQSATFNKAGGEGIAYTRGARVYNIGRATGIELPEVITYAISANNELTMTSRQTQFQPVSIGENIVMLKAWYCKDTVNSPANTITSCDQTIPTNPAAWRQVIAVQFSVVARSPNKEPALVSDASLKLWSDMTLPGGTVLSGPTLTLTTDQRYYRYRVYETLVPVRNMIWQIPTS